MGMDTKTVKCVHWNLGSRKFENKTDDIQSMVNDLKPDLAGISEANLSLNVSGHLNLIQGYNVVTSKDTNTTKFSRIAVLVKEGVNYEVLEDSMEEGIATIWIKIPLKGRPPLVVGFIYREHKIDT